jgi:hypothetical protein
MTQVTHRDESTGARPVLYMAMELSATKWHMVFGVGLASPVRHRTIAAGAVEQLREEVRRDSDCPPTRRCRAATKPGETGSGSIGV